MESLRVRGLGGTPYHEATAADGSRRRSCVLKNNRVALEDATLWYSSLCTVDGINS